MRKGLSVLLLVIAVGCLGAFSGVAPYDCPGCVQLRVGHAEYVYGPVGNLLDSPFFTLGTVPDALLGFSANGNTDIIVKGSLNSTILQNPPIALPIGNKGNFDECGDWLNSAIEEGDLVRGWYHAEQNCDYSNNGQTYKSIAYCESSTGGSSFQRPSYPKNQILTGNLPSIPGRTVGNGDHTVVKWTDGFYYLYFIDWDYYSYSVARAPVISGGIPGSWLKYYKGGFTSPGLGGNASAVPNLVGSTVHVHSSGNLFNIFSGVTIQFAKDPVTWVSFEDPVYYSQYDQWDRSEQSAELIAYPSLVPIQGGPGPLGNNFWLYYTYLAPGTDFSQRYLIRREVSMTIGSFNNTGPKVGVELSVFKNGTYNSWTTTSIHTTTKQFSYAGSLGFILTNQYSNTVALYDCYITSSSSYYLAANNECNYGGISLRKLGWIYSTQQQNTRPIYFCVDQTTKITFTSINSNCDGRSSQYKILGFVMTS